jgi:hypothetical protein
MNYGENEFMDVKPSIANYVILLFSAHIAQLNTNQSKLRAYGFAFLGLRGFKRF